MMKPLKVTCPGCGGELLRHSSIEYKDAATFTARCVLCRDLFEVRVARVAPIGTRRRGTGIPRRRGKRKWLQKRPSN